MSDNSSIAPADSAVAAPDVPADSAVIAPAAPADSAVAAPDAPADSAVAAPDAFAALPDLSKPSPLLREMDIVFSGADIDPRVDRDLLELGQGLTLPGFRRGKVPLSILRKRYGVQKLHEVLQRAALLKFQEQLDKTGERAAAQPRLVLPNVVVDGKYTVKCVFEVVPVVPEPDFTGLKLLTPTFEVDDAATDEMMEILRRQRGHFVTVDGEAEDHPDWRLIVNFESRRLDGEGEDGEEVVIETGQGRPLLHASPHINPDLGRQLRRARAGTRAEAVIPPSPAAAAGEPGAGSGKPLRFSLEVVRVEKLEKAALDADFFALFGEDCESVEDFRKVVRRYLDRESGLRLRNFLQMRVMEKIVEATPAFEVPRTMLSTECQRLLQAALGRWQAQGMAHSAVQMSPQMFLPDAFRRVKLGLILSAWRNRHNPDIPPEQIEARVLEMSATYGDPEAMAAALRQNKAEMDAIYLSLVEDRVVDWVCERCEREEKPMNLNDFLNDSAMLGGSATAGTV